MRKSGRPDLRRERAAQSADTDALGEGATSPTATGLFAETTPLPRELVSACGAALSRKGRGHTNEPLARGAQVSPGSRRLARRSNRYRLHDVQMDPAASGAALGP